MQREEPLKSQLRRARNPSTRTLAAAADNTGCISIALAASSSEPHLQRRKARDLRGIRRSPWPSPLDLRGASESGREGEKASATSTPNGIDRGPTLPHKRKKKKKRGRCSLLGFGEIRKRLLAFPRERKSVGGRRRERCEWISTVLTSTLERENPARLSRGVRMRTRDIHRPILHHSIAAAYFLTVVIHSLSLGR